MKKTILVLFLLIVAGVLSSVMAGGFNPNNGLFLIMVLLLFIGFLDFARAK